jgi:hypothetical protein
VEATEKTRIPSEPANFPDRHEPEDPPHSASYRTPGARG